MGAIRPRQGSGTYVTALEDQTVEKLISLGVTLQRATVREIIEARRVLEIDAVRMAAERHTESDRRDLEAINQAMIASSTEPAKASRYDLQYHVRLASASHNAVLVHFINGMRALLEIWMTKAVNRMPVVEDIVREHTSVLEAVFDRNPDEAANRMHLHLVNAAERLFSVVGKDHLMADYLSLLLAPGSGEQIGRPASVPVVELT
jgi:GntR family transcriptional repressor for pyruvate dehydrogenase complex